MFILKMYNDIRMVSLVAGLQIVVILNLLNGVVLKSQGSLV